MVNELVRGISQTKRIAILTGAGMSTESGLPDFRSQDGLWRKYRPEELASVDALQHRPLLFYEFYRFRLELLEQAAPNPAHRALVELEGRGRLQTIVTQNVDGFHTEAGSRSVTEIHGSLRQAGCHDCGREHPVALLQKPIHNLAELPRCTCGGLIRPGVVLFGEMLPQKALSQAIEAIELCDGLLIIGSSLQVHPAAALPQRVLERNQPVWIVNLAPTPYDDAADIVIREKSGEVLPKVVANLLDLDLRNDRL